MPCINFPIDPIGPTLDIGISAPGSLLAAGTPAPRITWLKGIADTGCSHTSIHASVAAACGLIVMGKSSANTPAGTVAVNIYHGDLFLRSLLSWTSPFEWKFNDRGFLEMKAKNPAFDVLLGMDILNLGAFSTNGGLKQATFCW
jgi:hypothetical protein